MMLEGWAFSQADVILNDENCFRFIAVSDTDQVSFTPTVTVKRTWDGRWLNMILVWLVLIVVLRVFRDKIISIPRKTPTSER
jgi:hypothetical protein